MSLPTAPTPGLRQRALSNSAGSQAAIIVVVTIAILLSLVFISYMTLKHLRKLHPNPRYIPTQALKRRWEAWDPRASRNSKDGYSGRLQDNASVPTLHLRSDNRSSRHASTLLLPDGDRVQSSVGMEMTTDNTSTAAVDRHTSVRSVMTLPTYTSDARENEQVLGREGERDGIDVVIEQPETAEEEEARRDAEMESLYQIRQVRRNEIAEREQRSRNRQEARARGDTEALRRIREASARSAEEREAFGATALIREHRARSRERRVSSVSYGDVGIARHDGSRIRASSNESDRPLLDSAASIGGGGSSLRPWVTQSTVGMHHRDRSTSTLATTSELEDGDSEAQRPPFGRAGSDFEIVTLGQGQHSRNGSHVHTPLTPHSRASSMGRSSPLVLQTTNDTGSDQMPSTNPPAYNQDGFEDAPPYESPVRDQADDARERSYSPSGAPLLPTLGRLPSIRVAEISPAEETEQAHAPLSGSHEAPR